MFQQPTICYDFATDLDTCTFRVHPGFNRRTGMKNRVDIGAISDIYNWTSDDDVTFRHGDLTITVIVHRDHVSFMHRLLAIMAGAIKEQSSNRGIELKDVTVLYRSGTAVELTNPCSRMVVSGLDSRFATREALAA